MHKACRTANVAKAMFIVLIIFVSIVPPTSANDKNNLETIGTPAKEDLVTEKANEEVNDQEETLEKGEADQLEETQEAAEEEVAGEEQPEEVLAPEETREGLEEPQQESDTNETQEGSTESDHGCTHRRRAMAQNPAHGGRRYRHHRLACTAAGSRQPRGEALDRCAALRYGHRR